MRTEYEKYADEWLAHKLESKSFTALIWIGITTSTLGLIAWMLLFLHKLGVL